MYVAVSNGPTTRWLSTDATDRRSAQELTRAAVAASLGVDPGVFDVEVTTG
jgi:hypothetical protein